MRKEIKIRGLVIKGHWHLICIWQNVLETSRDSYENKRSMWLDNKKCTDKIIRKQHEKHLVCIIAADIKCTPPEK